MIRRCSPLRATTPICDRRRWTIPRTTARGRNGAWRSTMTSDRRVLAAVLAAQRFGGSFAFQFGALATTLDETSEFQPFGTGRSFTYSDVVAGMAYARRWTDKLLVGFGLKYVREDLGSEVGGPVTNAALV